MLASRPRAEKAVCPGCRVDVTDRSPGSIRRVRDLIELHGVEISALGYYPNPLTTDRAETGGDPLPLPPDRRCGRTEASASSQLVRPAATRRSVEANWPRFLGSLAAWSGHAEESVVRIGIENCPMLFTDDEWPGGKNLATLPGNLAADVCRPKPELRTELRSLAPHLATDRLFLAPDRVSRPKLVHIHAKDAQQIERAAARRARRAQFTPSSGHTPKLPGLGDVRWGSLPRRPGRHRANGHVAVEVEDRAYEGSIEKRPRR